MPETQPLKVHLLYGQLLLHTEKEGRGVICLAMPSRILAQGRADSRVPVPSSPCLPRAGMKPQTLSVVRPGTACAHLVSCMQTFTAKTWEGVQDLELEALNLHRKRKETWEGFVRGKKCCPML